jgi:probable HAF family extracellular repeat protein
MRRPLCALACVSLLVAPFPASAGYLITDLGSLSPSGLNNSGEVAGTFTTSPLQFYAALWSGGTTTDLGFGPQSVAIGINASGQVAGSTYGGRAFLYSGGKLTDLGTLPGYAASWALGINDPGQVVGISYTTDGLQRAFLYAGGTMTDLGTLGGATSRAAGINAAGQVVGESKTASGATHAFLSSGGKMMDLGTLGGAYVGSSATAVNASGQVVGVSYTADLAYGHVFRYSNGTMVNLGGLGGPYSVPYGINTAGQVVGSTRDAQNYDRAFLYSKGQMMDLNALLPSGTGFTLTVASGINDKGQIIASGSNGHGYLLTPDGLSATPEPSALALLALGGAGLLACRRRRRAAPVA